MSTTVDLGKITASVTVGTTTTGAAGTNASVSNSGTTQDAVLNFTIPRGAQGVQGPQGIQGNTGPAGPTGPQGPMGDVAVITPEQQDAFTMYSVPGQNTDGPMTQKAVTDALVASAISYDNLQSGLVAENMQGALDEVGEIIYSFKKVSTPTAPPNKWINESNQWVSRSSTYTFLVPVTEGETYRIAAEETAAASVQFAWLTNNSTKGSASYVQGTAKGFVQPNKSVIVTVPPTAHYLYILSYINKNKRFKSLELRNDIIEKLTDDVDKLSNVFPLRINDSTISLSNSIILSSEGDSLEVDVTVGCGTLLQKGYGFAQNTHSSGIGIGLSYSQIGVRADDGTFILPVDNTLRPLKTRYTFKIVYSSTSIQFYIDDVLIYTYNGTKTLTITSLGYNTTYGYWVGIINSFKVNGTEYQFAEDIISNTVLDDYECPIQMISKMTDELDVYQHLREQFYVCYHMKHQSKAYKSNKYPSYYDNWGLREPSICYYTGTGMNEMITIFRDGEAEIAVQAISGQNNIAYVGGRTHGFENIKVSDSIRQFSIIVDNKHIDEDGIINLSQCKKIDIAQYTQMVQAYTNSNPFADVIKKWVFSDGKVKMSSSITFIRALKIQRIQQAMMCVFRQISDNFGSFYLTDKAIKENEPYIVYNVSDGWEDVEANAPLTIPDSGCHKITEYGGTSIGFSLAIENNNGESNGGMFVGTNDSTYNKIYFESHSDEEIVSVGKEYYASQIWEIYM